MPISSVAYVSGADLARMIRDKEVSAVEVMQATLARGMLLLWAYALGLGIPFFLSAVALNWFLAGSAGVRRWLLPLERLAGAVLLLIGVLLLTGQFAALSALLSRFTPAIEVGL